MATARARGGPISLSEKRPFNGSARIYFERGWLPMPLPPKKKSKPPTGYTGWDATRVVTQKQVDAWLSEVNPSSNIALRPAKLYMGIDVDAYKDAGDDTYARIIEEIGGLPPTWISSARVDGKSGIRHYRLPEGAEKLKWPGKIGGGIETVHFGHRYIVAPPSVHPEKDEHGQPQVYAWYAPGEDPYGVNASHDIPRWEDLTKLSMELVEYFTRGQFSKHLPAKDLGSVAQSKKKVSAWIEARGGEPCAAMISAWETITDEFVGFGAASAHDSARDGLYRLACLSAEGHPGLSEAVSRLHDEFVKEVTRDDRDGASRGLGESEAEWLRFRDGAVKKVMRREDDGDFIGSACTCTGLDSTGRPKQKLDVNAYHLPTAIETCYKAMAAGPDRNWQGLYYTEGTPYILDGEHFAPLNVDTLREEVTRDVDWIKWVGGDEPRPVPQPPPTTFLASMLQSRAAKSLLPELRGVMRTPFYALVDGKPKLIHSNGYHPDASVYMNLDESLGVTIENMREVPDDKLPWAKRWIEEAIKGFPFKHPGADRAAFYAALILPFVRDLIKGPTPLHLVGAPLPRSGKTLLCDVVAMVACGELSASAGRQMISIGKGKDRIEKMEKAVTAAMRTMPRVLVLDNISGTLDSPDLASALTNDVYTGRVLGESRNLDIPNRTLWMATGNNIQASLEIQQRIVPCWIDNEGQKTKHDVDLREYIPENRARLVWAVLTLVSNWVHKGCPAPPADWVPLPGYEAWGRVIGGILFANGIKGLLSNAAEFVEGSTDDGHSLVDLYREWEQRYGLGVKVKAREALGALEFARELVDTSKGNAANTLGWILNGQKDVPHGDFVLRKVVMQKTAYYRLEKIGQPTKVRRGRKPKNKAENE